MRLLAVVKFGENETTDEQRTLAISFGDAALNNGGNPPPGMPMANATASPNGTLRVSEAPPKEAHQSPAVGKPSCIALVHRNAVSSRCTQIIN
ncbi:hypothetical protein NIES4073_29440 [Kalymmatonema gypsitolerans NIES-4073]|nr:hypothetical protein NIES4073_29440 [Scytonema sp. NIES-4073]